jgi:PAS domain-containing protein
LQKATGVVKPYEKEFFRKDGSRLPVLVGWALFEGGNEGVAFVPDLSEQKRAEEKIREQEMEFRQMLELGPQQVAVFGPGGEHLYANRIGLDYVGLSLEEWRQTSVNELRSAAFAEFTELARFTGAEPANLSLSSFIFINLEMAAALLSLG